MKNREPKDEFKDLMDEKERLHTERMEEKIDNDIEELSYENFLKEFNMLKRKEGGKYDFVVKGGESLLCALFHLFKTIWKIIQ